MLLFAVYYDQFPIWFRQIPSDKEDTDGESDEEAAEGGDEEIEGKPKGGKLGQEINLVDSDSEGG